MQCDETIAPEKLRTTREFWDANPCGAHGSFQQQWSQRYAMEPWLLPILSEIGRTHRSILEDGCGQGTDMIAICRAMAPGGRCEAIDCSSASVEIARRHVADLVDTLAVTPAIHVANAEALPFAEASFEAVYSMGVLHHTADTPKSIDEVRRVLEPGGTAYVILYRKPAPKVLVAKILRGIQHITDFVFRTDRGIYQILRRRSSHSALFGTMFHECFGVPYMGWYTAHELRRMFRDFSSIEMVSMGANLGRLVGRTTKPNPVGYFWYVKAKR